MPLHNQDCKIREARKKTRRLFAAIYKELQLFPLSRESCGLPKFCGIVSFSASASQKKVGRKRDFKKFRIHSIHAHAQGNFDEYSKY